MAKITTRKPLTDDELHRLEHDSLGFPSPHHDRVCRLIEEVRMLRAVAEQAKTLLWKCRCDIWQTARANQTNLNGVDPLFPDDGPCPGCIGKNQVHQAGIDESMGLIRRVEQFLHAAAHAHAKAD